MSHIYTNTAPVATTTTAYGLTYWAKQTLTTRRYGSTYVHTGAREEAESKLDTLGEENTGGIRFSFKGFGRSLQTGGHKYKVHAYRDGKPVPSKELKALLK